MARLATWTGSGWRWLESRGMQPLGVAGLAAMAATALFASSGLLRAACDGCAYLLVPADVLVALGAVAVLAGLASVGHWIGGATQRTWLERLQLELAGMDLDDQPDRERQRRLKAFGSPTSAVAEIQARGRGNLWTGAPVAVASLLALPDAAGSFGHIEQASAFLFPLLVLSIVAGVAATLRGITLLRAVRRLMAPHRGIAAEAEAS